MTIKKLLNSSKKTISLIILALSPLMSLGFYGVSHATAATYYWCGDSTTTNGAKMNTAANWSTATDCSTASSVVPTAGDVIIFDAGMTIPSAHPLATDVTDDITTNPAFASVTFTGDTLGSSKVADGFSITSASSSKFSVAGTMTFNMTNTNSAPTVLFQDNILLGGNTTVSVAAGNSVEFKSGAGTTSTPSIEAGTYNLTFTGAGSVKIDDQFTGSGNLVINLTTAVSGTTATGYINFVNPTTFTGSVTTSSAIFEASDNLATASGLTISGNGLLVYTGTTDLTIAEPVTMGGSGPALCEIVASGTSTPANCGPAFNNGSALHNITFTGDVTLTANTSFLVGNGTSTYGVTIHNATLSGSFTLENRIGFLTINSTTNNSLTKNDTYGPTQPGSTSTIGTPAGSTPDTGFGIMSTTAIEGLAGSVLIISAIFVAKKKFSRN